MGTAATRKCGLTEVLVFLVALVTGTACSICSKVMMDLHGIGMTGEVEKFSKPMFQTFGMFVGMTFGLVMHGVVLYFRIPFPGYHFPEPSQGAPPAYRPTESDPLVVKKVEQNPTRPDSTSIPVWMYFFLAIPAVFDLGATALCMMGLRYLDVSIYQLLRGSGIIFVALMKQHVLGDNLYRFQWLGVAWNVMAVLLVGATAILSSSTESHEVDGSYVLLGILLVLTGAFVQALQFVFEEKVMTMDIPSPPLLLIGMEGLWGTVLCLIVVYPLVYFLPGDDHGSYENFWNTWAMIKNTQAIKLMFIVYFFAIFGYNLFAVLVTYLLNSIWHAILDNFRPITVWLTDMFIYYVVNKAFGEAWTQYSWLQLGGMFVLLYGTSVYNAPHPGSIWLRGEWYSFGIDYSKDYVEIQEHIRDAELDAEWEARQQTFVQRTNSSFLGERSPFVSAHTQNLRGLSSPKV
jgi:drug/metabolite transporter (DMT)-like permease